METHPYMHSVPAHLERAPFLISPYDTTNSREKHLDLTLFCFCFLGEQVAEKAIAGLQYVFFGQIIGLIRAFYMATSNYFTILVWDGFGVSGVFGEGVASCSRHAFILPAALSFLFVWQPNRKRFWGFWRSQPSSATWRLFLRDGGALALSGYQTHLSSYS